LGAEVVKLTGTDVAATLLEFAGEKGVTLILTGQSRRPWFQHPFRGSVVAQLVKNTQGLDVLVASGVDREDD
jgi:two-component system sensor histidine kinase KdpD